MHALRWIFLLLLSALTGLQGQPTQNHVLAVAWSNDGTKVASVGTNGMFQIWDANTGDRLLLINDLSETLYAVGWSPDDAYIATGGEDQLLRIWNAETGEQITTLEGHGSTITHLDWSNDGRYLASTSIIAPSPLIIWDMESYENVASLYITDPYHVTWSEDTTSLLVAASSGVYEFPQNLDLGDEAAPIPNFSVLDAYAIAAKWNSDETEIAALSGDGRIYILDAEDHTVKRSWEFDAPDGPRLLGYTLAWNHDDSLLASYGTTGQVQVWDPDTGELVDNFTGRDEQNIVATGIAFSPYGGRLAYGTTIQDARTLADSGVAIVAPAPSIARLSAIEAACSLTNLPTVTEDADSLQAYITTLTSDETIDPVCAADLTAVAQALLD